MRLSRPAAFSRRKNQRLGTGIRSRKKHKRLDAICEKVYSRNHTVLVPEARECNGGGSGSIGNETELRRSSRARRAPVLLDVSPLPPKKRQRTDKGIGNDFVERLRRKDRVKSESPCSTSKDVEEESGEWRSRLRSRPNNMSFRMRGVGDTSPKGKRKLFEESDGFTYRSKLEGGGLSGKNEGFGGKKVTATKTHKPNSSKLSNLLNNEFKEICSGSVLENHKDKSKVELLQDIGEDTLLLDNEVVGENEEHEHDVPSTKLLEEEEDQIPPSLHSEECMVNSNRHPIEQHEVYEQPHIMIDMENQKDTLAVSGQQQDGKATDKPLESEASRYVHKTNYPLKNELSKPRIKKGRRCDLCGGGTDGKPPKILLQDGLGSDGEAYSGSSAAEEAKYNMWDGFGDEPGWLGRLLGPINDRFGIAGIWVHQHCAVWSPEVYFAGLGCLKNVRAALCRGRLLKCSRCGRRGATIGCRVDRCTKTYHLPCARANGCIFNHRKFLIACTDHRNIFQPRGSKRNSWLKKMKVNKMKMEIKKQSNDAWRKDVEAEEKWLENCGEDEEFLKRENKRLQRDLLRIAPIYIGGSKTDNETQFQGWESVAGLQNVIQCLKEVVILPLLYPDFFSNIGLTPPRGVLLHGYPGTGKTLVVRSLIGACARGDKRIAYFARKGADCLGKYVGDAERQLRLLFQVAEKSQPSIIFFDEIDGLAPSRTRQQDQTHSSVVSTLLALLDGLKSRGSVVVIGATNRPDAVDPALRRPGRFDREIYFPLPSVQDRESILSLHTKKWPKPATGSLLKWIARKTAGFAGADLQALCTQAAIVALKRSCPLHKILSEVEETTGHVMRPALPSFSVEERDWLEALSCAPPPCARREAGMAANDVVASPLPAHLLPCLIQPLSTLLLSIYLDERTWLPPPLSKASRLIKSVILSSLDKKNIRGKSWWTHAHGLLQEADILSEIASSLSHESILVGDTCFEGIDALDEDASDVETLGIQSLVTHSALLQNGSLVGNKSGFRMLISGDPCGGQKHIASCILHCFVGNVEIRKIDLATIAQEGHGDLLHGVTQILSRCTCLGSCIIYMPRIDLWAVETSYEEESHSPATNIEIMEGSLKHSHFDRGQNLTEGTSAESFQDPIPKASHLWSSFIEQVESICVSTSLIILATSEIPYPLLPHGIRQFFESDTLNCSLSAPLKDAVPRFSILVGRNFDCDMVMELSAAKLSKDLGKYYFQLIYCKAHITEGSDTESKASDTVRIDANVVCQNCEPGLTTHPAGLPNPIVRDSLPSLTKNIKGKSNLMLAILTFGYQILLYPHFAELCWATSKLKEGPCADISGPWKGWPFNSCIVRPKEDSLEKEQLVVACSSANTKFNRKSGVVRGLTAVGLLAYRGMYTSLKEVVAEVRKVLELLALRVNAKIENENDGYKYGRLLSQVAYLEDLVNSWAYMLRSLEVHGQVTESDPRLACVGSHDNIKTYEDNLVHGDNGDKHVTENSLLEPESRSPVKLSATDSRSVPLNKDVSGQLIREVTVSISQGPLHHTSLQFQNYEDANVSVLNGKDVNTQSHVIKSSENDVKVNEVLGPISNGYTPTDSVVRLRDGLCASGDMDCGKHVDGEKDSNQDDSVLFSDEIHMPSAEVNKISCRENNDVDCTLNITNAPAEPNVLCWYRCCSKCLVMLQQLVRKNLYYQRGLRGSQWTVEDLHDCVKSSSKHLHSEVRKFCLGETSTSSLGENIKHYNHANLVKGQQTKVCGNGNSGCKVIRPVECTSHPRMKSSTEKASSLNPQELELELIYKDGVVISVDPKKDVSWHCKFESICLCSLIEWLVMTKQPSD